MDAAKAILDATDLKIESLTKRVKHLRDVNDSDKGYITDTTENKKGAEIEYEKWKGLRIDEEKEEERLKKVLEDAKKARDEDKQKYEDQDKKTKEAL